MQIVLAFILAAAALIAGCGDEDAGSPAVGSRQAQAPALSQAEWRKQADAICQATDEAVEKLGEPTELDEVARMVDDVQALLARELEQLQRLTAPEEIGADVERMLDLQAQEVEAFDELRAAAETGTRDEFLTVAENASGPSDEANAIADGLGLEWCEDPPG